MPQQLEINEFWFQDSWTKQLQIYFKPIDLLMLKALELLTHLKIRRRIFHLNIKAFLHHEGTIADFPLNYSAGVF